MNLPTKGCVENKAVDDTSTPGLLRRSAPITKWTPVVERLAFVVNEDEQLPSCLQGVYCSATDSVTVHNTRTHELIVRVTAVLPDASRIIFDTDMQGKMYVYV